ncbi:MAG: hypothetical protein HRU40_06320 [Saprospiraceae bacterium]|nr:hypothetical protein [Saprospiraceae bacterium]
MFSEKKNRVFSFGKLALILAFVLPLAVWSCESAGGDEDASEQTEMEAEPAAGGQHPAGGEHPAGDSHEHPADSTEADTTSGQ